MTEDHVTTLKVALELLDSAAMPTKCEVYSVCGGPAADLHDAISALLSEVERLRGEVKALSDKAERDRRDGRDTLAEVRDILGEDYGPGHFPSDAVRIAHQRLDVALSQEGHRDG